MWGQLAACCGKLALGGGIGQYFLAAEIGKEGVEIRE
jgi:hypothetical protein